MVVPMTSHHQQQQQQQRNASVAGQQSPYAQGWSSPQHQPVSPVSSYDVRNFSRPGAPTSRHSPTSPQRSSQPEMSPTSPSRMPPPSGQTPTRGILSQRRSMPAQPSSSRTPRTHHEPGTRINRLPSSSNYIPSPQSSTGVVQNIPESIDRAGKIMESLFNKDLQNPSLFTALVGREQSGLHPVSGLVDQDYPGVVERGLLSDKLFTIQHQTPIPPELRELLAQSELGSCHMGLFTEICRAWMTIDSDLYLWDFRDGSDLSFYDGLRESILGLALVPVKKNVFKSAIRHLLCVTTPSQVVILGFVLSNNEPRSSPTSSTKATLELVPHPIFTLSSEQVRFPVIVASKHGRIFLGGFDGTVHEIGYQAGRGWLRERCWKQDMTTSYLSSYLPKFLSVSTPSPIQDIVIDSERNILFTLSTSGTIQAFDLGEDGTSFSRLASLSQETIVNSVITLSKKTLESNTVRNILGIAVIEYGELNLVAMTGEGTRLYFTCLPRPGLGMTPTTRPSTLKLAHIRLPPGYTPMSNMKRPSGAHIAYYGNGLYAMATHSSHESDVVWLVTPFLYPTNNYTEVSSVHVLPGSTIEMQEIRSKDIDQRVLEQPEVITQHLPWRREIVILSSHGVTVLRGAKPFELLRDLLQERQGPENIKGHFEMTHNKVHPLANAVLLATHPFMFQDNNMYEWATKSLYLYGGGTEVAMRPAPTGQRVSFDLRPSPGPGFQDVGSIGDRNSSIGTPKEYQQPGGWAGSASSSYLSDSSPNFNSPAMSSTFYNDQNSPTSFAAPGSPQVPPYSAHPQFPANFQPQQQQQQQLFSGIPAEQWPYSSRHDAIYTVVGRILGPFWNTRLIRPAVIDGTKTNVILPNINGEQVTYAMSFLQSLHNFMLNNPSLYVTSYKLNINPGQMNATPEGRRLMNYELEKTSMASLKNFLSQTLEVLGMWKILCDHQFHIVLKGVDDRLHNATLRELVVGGQNTISIIINALITKYLGDNAAVDAISLRLREVCPTLFRNEDAIGSKVSELLAKAKNTGDPAEKASLLQDSLVLCEQMCGHGRVNVRNFCNQFADLGFPLGAVRLVSSASKAIDPNQLALLTVKSTANLDPAAIIAFNNRCDNYNVIFEMLDKYLDTSSRQSPLSGRKSDEKLPSTKSGLYSDETIRAILSSDDETFHIMLYNWLLERKLYDRLLDIQHQFLDTFLQRAAESVVSGKWPRSTMNGNDSRVLDLLWRYHEMNQNHLAAAQILSKLAESSTPGLDFHQRFEYLARAAVCAKGIGHRGEVLDALEDKVEVAQIQKMIIDTLSNRASNISGSATTFDHSSNNEIKAIQEALHRLSTQLFNITSLFADFAVPFKLNEAKLEIFHSAGHSEKNLIESLWADIIEAELSTSSRQSMESQMEVIRRKLVTLGRKYIGSPTYFPLEYLIEHLESMKPSEKVDEGWVFKTMIEVGVSFTELLTVYERLWKRVVQGQTSSSGGVETQLARVVMSMITMFLNHEVEVRLHRSQMVELIEKCKDLISAMIVEFSSKFEPEAQEISTLLNSVKSRLDKQR